VLILQRINFYPECVYYQVHIRENISQESLDRALDLYRRNLFTLANFYRGRNTRLVFIPQVVNRKAFEGRKLQWWIPYVPDEDLEEMVSLYNQCMKEVADSMRVGFADTIIHSGWSESDFIDPSHLKPEANLRFAGLIRTEIENELN